MIIVVTILWLIAMVTLILWMALASKSDYTIDWSEKVEHKGVIKLLKIETPDEMFDDERDWIDYIQNKNK